jgi:hypothetical protein
MLTKRRSRALPSLIATAALSAAACAELGADAETSEDQVASENGFAYNGFAYNGFAYNGFAYNGFAFNGFAYNGFAFNGFAYNGLSFVDGISINGLSTSGGLSWTSGLMTTASGREAVKYMVKCAFPSGHRLTAQDNAVPPNTYTFDGAIGVAPELEFGTCDLNCQERVSACMLAHVNNSGVHVGIWLVGPDNGIGWETSPDYPYMEAAYFGNLFMANPKGNYCAGNNLSAGASLGRLGGSFGTGGGVLTSPYGTQWDGVNNQNVPAYCAFASLNHCTPQNAGFSSCADQSPQAPYPSGHAWMHPVTVYRNFEPTQLYKICNTNNKCLGVVGGSTSNGANVEQRTFTAAAGQTWQILQVSSGNYKIVNRTSGMSLDLNGAQAVQRPYTGTTSQIVPLTFIPGDPGRANLRMSSTTFSAQLLPSNLSGTDGALIQSVTSYPVGAGSPDQGRWSFIPVTLATFDPGRTVRLVPQNATNKSVDVPYLSTTNGTALQQYDTWPTDGQRFFLRDAGNGNVKLAMKVGQNKCIGPRANGTTLGTVLEVQDCNTTFNQAWLTSETAAGSGVFMFKNAGAPNLCLEVRNASTANGAVIDLWTCSNTASNQKFALLAN